MKKLFLFSFILYMFLFQSCENEEAPIDVAQVATQRTRDDEVSTFDALPEHIKESLLYSSTVLKEAAKQAKGKTTEFGDIVPDMAIEREYANGKTSYTLSLEKLEEGLYYDNIALQEYEDGSTEAFVIRYWPTLDWLKDYYGREDRYEYYTGTMEVYDGEGIIKSRLDLVEGELVDSKAFKNNTNRCIVHHRVSIGCAYSCWVSEIEIFYICNSSGGGAFGGGDFDDPVSGGGSPGGTGGSGGEPSINTTPVEGFQEIERLCGTYNFSKIGNAYVANIKNLGFDWASVAVDSGLLEFNTTTTNLCVGVPEEWTSASQIGRDFPIAYNNAVIELFALMNTVSPDTSITDAWIKQNLAFLVQANLNALFLDEFMNGTTLSSCDTSQLQWCSH